MRITGGALGGRRLHVPQSADIRPMRDQVRAALFNILSDVVEGSVFLDLFAGMGSVGLEALSRGAERATFVDQGHEAIDLLQRNVHALELVDRAEIIRDDVFRALDRFHQESRQFDLVFIGPPYGYDLAPKTLRHLSECSILNAEAIVMTEIFQKETLEDQYGVLRSFDERRYGDNRLIFYELAAHSD